MLLEIFNNVSNDLGFVILGKDSLDRYIAFIFFAFRLPFLVVLFRSWFYLLLGRSSFTNTLKVESQDDLGLTILVGLVPRGVKMQRVGEFLQESLITGGKRIDKDTAFSGGWLALSFSYEFSNLI